jgi:hypothetical protein
MLHILDVIQKITSIVQSITVVGAAFFALFKFRLYQSWKPTQKAEMVCSAQPTASKDFVFEAKYQIFNTGDRPLRIRHVVLKICHAKLEKDFHLAPDEANILGSRTVIAENEEEAKLIAKNDGQAGPDDHQFKAIGVLGYVNKGADSSFTLRCRLRELPDVIFVVAEFSWQGGTRTFRRMWVNESSSSAPVAQRTAASA